MKNVLISRSILLIVVLVIFSLCVFEAQVFANGSISILIAASDAEEDVKNTANYVCTGVDDHLIIQEAINSIAYTGGTITLTEGTFNIAGDMSITGNNTIFQGAGEDETLLVWSDGRFRATEREYVTFRDFKTTGTGALVLRNSNHVIVENITASIDDSLGAAAFTTFVNGTIVEDVEYRNCKAIDCGRHGWMSDGWDSPKLIKNIRYIDCEAINCGRYSRFTPHGQWTCGFQLGENCDVDGCEVINCLAEGNFEAGFIVEGAPTIKNMVIRDCIARNNGTKPDDYNNAPDENMYGCLFGAGFWLNGDITLYDCISENNRKAGYSVWMMPSPLTTKLYNCVDTGSEIGFRLDNTENVYLEDCISNEAGKYGIWAVNARNLTTVGLKIVEPNGDGEKCNAFGISGYPVTDSTFDLNTYGGEGTVVPCVNGENIVFAGTIRSDNENPVVVSGTTDISALNIIPYEGCLFNIESISFEDINGNPVTELSAKEMLIAVVSTKNKVESDIPATMIVALYDKNNTMKDVAFISKTVKGKEKVDFSVGMTMPANISGYYIKVFIWDSITMQNPYSDVVSFP